MRPERVLRVILVLLWLVAVRPTSSLRRASLLGGLEDSGGDEDPEGGLLADEFGPAKVKRNVRTYDSNMVLFSDTGYALEILPNGAINTTTNRTGSPYAVMNIKANKTIDGPVMRRHFTLRGVASGRYLCLSKKRQAFTSKYLRLNRCRFLIQPLGRRSAGFLISLYERRKDRRLQLAITKQGDVRVRHVRVPKRLRRPEEAASEKDKEDEEPPDEVTTEPAPAELSTEPAESSAELSGRQQTRRQLPTTEPTPTGHRRRHHRPGSRRQRAQRRAHRQRQRLKKQRQKKRQQKLLRQQQRQAKRQQRLQGQQRRRGGQIRRSREVRAGRPLLPSERVQKGSRRPRRPRRRHQRGRLAPPGSTFWIFSVKPAMLREAQRLERERLAEFAARCHSGAPGGGTDSWQQRTCGSLRVKRFSAEPPRLTTPEGAPPTAPPLPPVPAVSALTALTVRGNASVASEAIDTRDVSDSRDFSSGAGEPSVSRLDCVRRRREPGRAARCRQWRAIRRKYKLYLQYRRDLRRHGIV